MNNEFKAITASFTIRNSIHEDSWTEALGGVHYLLRSIDILDIKADNVNKIYLVRLSIVSSCYLTEIIFWNTVEKFVEETLTRLSQDIEAKKDSILLKNLLCDWRRRNRPKNIEIGRAIKEWPMILTGAKLEMGKQPFQSLTMLIRKRNSIVHSSVDSKHYKKAYELAGGALYTAIEASKAIENNFFPKREFSYKEWIDEFPPPTKIHYNEIATKQTLTLQKSRMPQILGVEGEAVVLYCEPSITQQMRYHRLSRRVNKMAVFACFQDVTFSGFQEYIKN